MREIPEKDQIPQTREGLQAYIKHLKRHIKSRNDLLETAEKRLETIEISLGYRKPETNYLRTETCQEHATTK